MIALTKELENAGFGKDVINSVLRFSKNVANGIDYIQEGECDDILTLVNIDYYYEGQDEEGRPVTISKLTFADKDGNEFSIQVDTEEECEKVEDLIEVKKRNEYFSLLN